MNIIETFEKSVRKKHLCRNGIRAKAINFKHEEHKDISQSTQTQ